MSRQLFSHPTEFFFWQKPGWDPVWDPKNPKPQKWLFQKVLQFDFWAMFLGQNELKNRFWTTKKSQSAQKHLFRPLFAFCRFFKIFQKSRFWRFCRCFSSAVRCPFELKITWGLCLALKSSQNNFQLKRTAHGGAGASAKSPKWASKGIPCDFWPFSSFAKKGIFGHFWVLSCA